MAGINSTELTRMLNEPEMLTDTDAQNIAILTETYPYFVPAQYLEAAIQHRKEPFAQDMLQNLQLYRGNWLLLHELLQGKHLPETAASTQVAGNDTLQQEQESGKDVHATSAFEGKEHETIYAQPVNEAPPPRNDEPNIKEESVIQPVYTEDYFLHQGIEVSNELPDNADENIVEQEDGEKSLMVVMSFAEWLAFFKNKKEKQKEEEQDQKALKTMWQKEKLAAALEEENEEIPENVFEMAVNSITQEEGLASESLAEIYVKQEKYDKAIDMYRKLSLRNPQKSAYFARKIEILQKEQKS